MDPFVIIKALHVAMLVIMGGALYVFYHSAERTPWLLHWSLYEFALAVVIAVDGHMLATSLGVGVAVPVLLLGIFGYRKTQPPPFYSFVLLFLAIALPGYGLAVFADKTYGLIYLTLAISIGYLAAAGQFLKEGGGLNRFIAAAFALRAVNAVLYPLWEAWDMLYISYGGGQVLALMAGVGLLMAGFDRAYNKLKKHEQELRVAYGQSEELMARLERRNQEYLAARQNAEASSAAKSQFLANMSHELRTPLNAILGFSEVLAVMPKQKILDKVGDYARNIHEAASGLQVIISDILNLSRVEAGALETEREACDLSAIIGGALRLLQPLADQKDISLDNRAETACVALCDPRLTRQAVINGITNAIKYTQRGGTVICSAANEDGFAIATVEDNGIGIDDARLAMVFEPFWQEGNSFLAENNGVGLGLTIARSYIEAQGGRIELKRAGERGTLFRICLPAAESRAEPETQVTSPAAS